jgi:hypothetical protein
LALTKVTGDMLGSSVSFGLKSVQTFTSSGTWNKPAGVTKVIVEVQGAGGGGGSGDNYGGQIGGGGGYAKKMIDVSSIASSTITVGSGGAGGIPIVNGSNGGDSIWSDGTNTVTGGGGIGGKFGNGGGVVNITVKGSASGGDINIEGGETGHSMFGFAGQRWNVNATATDNATGYGSGGCAPANIVNGDNYTGAPGRSGIVIVWEYA